MKDKFPKEREWEKIVDNAFSSDEKHIFSEQYEMQKRCMQKGITMKRERIKIKNHKISSGALSVAAAAIILVPSTIYGFGKLNANVEPSYQPEETEQTQETTEEVTTEPAEAEELVEETAEEKHPTGIEQTAPYANTVYINFNAEDKEVKNMKAEFGWLPDSLSPYGVKFKNENMGGMSPIFNKVPKDGIKEVLYFSEHFEQYETDDKIIMINYRQSYDEESAKSNNFGREMWIAFKEQPYALNLYFTDDISNDDAKQIAENVYLVETDEFTPEWFKQEESFSDSDDSYSYSYSDPFDIEYDSDLAKFYKIGETCINERPEEYGYDAPEITVTNVWIQDNFDGISTDAAGYYRDYSEFIDENGNIISGTREWVELGNGFDTLNEVIHSEEVNRHILVIEATYKNCKDVPMEEICICPELYTKVDGKMRPVGAVKYDDIYSPEISPRLTSDMGSQFSFWSDSSIRKNNIYIGAGESATVKLAFEIYDENIGNLYYLPDPTNICGVNEFNTSPIVDLCDVKPEN